MYMFPTSPWEEVQRTEKILNQNNILKSAFSTCPETTRISSTSIQPKKLRRRLFSNWCRTRFYHLSRFNFVFVLFFLAEMFPANRISMPPIAQDFIPLIYQRNEEVLKRGRSILFQWFLFAGMCVYKTINISRPDYLRFDTFFFFFFYLSIRRRGFTYVCTT